MKIRTDKVHTFVWLSKRDTFRWAHRPHKSWPCSTISDKRIFVKMKKKGGDLVDLRVNGKYPKSLDMEELRYCLKDLLKGKGND